MQINNVQKLPDVIECLQLLSEGSSGSRPMMCVAFLTGFFDFSASDSSTKTVEQTRTHTNIHA